MAGLFVHDIEEGIQGTDVKAAFIKCAADEPGVTERIEKVHRAAARASLRTGAPIMAHSRPASGTGPAPGRDLPRGGRGAREDPDRPHRRHRRPRLHREAARQGRVHRDGPLRARAVPAGGPAQRDRDRAAGARLRRAHVPVAGLRHPDRGRPGLVPARDGRAARRRGRGRQLEHDAPLRARDPDAEGGRDDRRAARHDDGREPRRAGSGGRLGPDLALSEAAQTRAPSNVHYHPGTSPARSSSTSPPPTT